jgi:hypothetical protein
LDWQQWSATPAVAQTAGPRTALLASSGASSFDLSGTGMTPGFALRASGALGANLVFEGGLLLARPEQQFGDSTLMMIPEAQLQHHCAPQGREL